MENVRDVLRTGSHPDQRLHPKVANQVGGDVRGQRQSEPFRFFCIAAKYAEAFTKKALSFSRSATCLRNRCSSARSAASRDLSPWTAAAVVLRRRL
jgi:hypothetical protein